jgi:hypothetical protein
MKPPVEDIMISEELKNSEMTIVAILPSQRTRMIFINLFDGLNFLR